MVAAGLQHGKTTKAPEQGGLHWAGPSADERQAL